MVTTADIKNMKAARLKMKAEKEKAAAAEKQYKIDMERSTSLQLELLERNRRMAMESANHAYTGSESIVGILTIIDLCETALYLRNCVFIT